jgi:hypothetical protein
MSAIERFETQSGQPLAPRYPLTLERRPRWHAITERPAAQRFPTMRGQPVPQLRALRHDPRRVDVGMHDVVVLLDLDEVDGVARRRSAQNLLGRIGLVGQRLVQLDARVDAELGEHVTQVVFDGPRADE